MKTSTLRALAWVLALAAPAWAFQLPTPNFATLTLITSSPTVTLVNDAQELVILQGAATQTITLPPVASQNRVLTIKDGACNASTYGRIIVPQGSDVIDVTFNAGNNGVGLYANCAARTLAPSAIGWVLE